MNRLIAIVGPTGVGKSRLALHLTQKFGGEIVSADSRQVYRYMDIGTAKPSLEERSLIPHHLIDIVNPDEEFSLATYQDLACRAIGDIQQRLRLPFLVGGSGQYIWAVLEGWKTPPVPPDPDFRYNLEQRAARGEADGLYQELVRIDPVAAQKIDRRNVRRLIRALEVYSKTNVPFSRLQHKEAPPFDIFIIGLTAERAELYRRIDQRVDEMIARGLVAEVENLVKMGYDITLPAMSSVGYRHIGQYLSGKLTLAAATSQIKTETHRLVRHQYAWFRIKDERIHWFDIQQPPDAEVEAEVATFLRKSLRVE